LKEPKSTSKRSLRAWSAGILLLVLLALVLGVFGAVYFEQNQPGASRVASNQPSPNSSGSGPVAPAPVTPPFAATPAPENKPQNQAARPPESVPSQTAQAPATINPTGTSTASPAPAPAPVAEAPTPPDVQSLAQISPSAAPANIAAAVPRYWVEYGAYDGSFYADRLKQSLEKLGIATTLAEAPGKHGRRYLRVRGTDLGDRDIALAQLAKAHESLHIAPLLHRIAAVSPGAARIAKTPPSGAHWVQFGAFHSRKNAEKMLVQLHKGDVQASVLEVKYFSRKPLYLVRVSGLADRAAAAQIAQQGTAALHSKDVLIGQSLRAAAVQPRAPPPH
jgi:cell division protein FtsN